MEQISDNKLFEFYNDTLNKCGIFLLDEEDEIIEYNLYEDFDIGIHSFFYLDSLKRLYDAELISLIKLNKSTLLYNKVLELQKTDEWKFEYFRKSSKWREIMKLSDEIKVMV